MPSRARFFRNLLEVETLQQEGVNTCIGLARQLTDRGVAAPGGGGVWTHTTVIRLMARIRA